MSTVVFTAPIYHIYGWACMGVWLTPSEISPLSIFSMAGHFMPVPDFYPSPLGGVQWTWHEGEPGYWLLHKWTETMSIAVGAGGGDRHRPAMAHPRFYSQMSGTP